MRRLLLMAVFMSVLPAAALAQAAGTWAGEIQGRGGSQQVKLMIAANGTSGTWTQGDQESELSEVKVDGNTVSFQRSVEFGGRGAVALTYNGVVDGDQLTLTTSFPGRGGAGGGGGGGGGGRQGGGRGAQPIVLTRQ